MLMSKTLKRYMDKCDELLDNPSDEKADSLITEIISVFQSEIEGLTNNLDTYSPYLGSDTINYMADIHLLRARLQKELMF